MKRLRIPIIVEGKYDKVKVKSVISATVITTDGFGIFRSEEKRALISALGKDGVVILCDSDGGGKVIRSHLKGMLSGVRVYNLYIPQIHGKERRKADYSKEGYLGVEGMEDGVLRSLFDSFERAHPELFEDGAVSIPAGGIKRSDMLSLGLTGVENAQENRDRLARSLSLPAGMNASALYEALGLLGVTYSDVEGRM